MNTRKNKTSFGKTAIIVAVFVAITLVVANIWTSAMRDRERLKKVAAKEHANERLVQQLVSSEELLLELTPQLKPLSKSIFNMQLPHSSAVDIFAYQVDLSGMLTKPPASSTSLKTKRWDIEQNPGSVAREDLRLWQPLFASTKYFENANIYFIRGNFSDETLNQFNSILGFDGLAIGNGGKYASIHAEMEVNWTRQATDSTNVSHWRIASWKQTDFTTLESTEPLFKDVLEVAIDDQELYLRATQSRHSQITSDVMAGKDYFLPPGETYPFFFPDVTLEHPGIAVVDIDDDGFDDLYIAMQHGTNFLFRNKGDGTFEEVAVDYGLDLKEDSTSAIFADFDNDGDPDLILGRARHRAMYFVNQDGRFVDHSKQLISCALPALVSSISAADFNGDGLLDIYISTYSPIEETNRFSAQQSALWLKHFLSPQQVAEFNRHNQASHRFKDRAGPPNVLLKNIGDGKFELAKENPQLELWRMTFQATWHDYDNDGDPDVYVANDYAPDNFFRNDGPKGFTDITFQSGLTELGFGMGVSFGDYDNDGQTDIYVSNMYSKAGQRITDQVPQIDPRLRQMAGGNVLYRRDAEKFSTASGLEETDVRVAKAGWSWGGQFFDLDNDGFRDIYALSGYYTAPTDISIDLDL